MVLGELHLSAALDLLERSLPLALGEHDALVVPPLLQDNLPSAEALQALAVLYLHAELEGAALVICAEAVAEQRAQLRVSAALAEALDRFADLARRTFTAGQREQLFQRLFGMASTGVAGPGRPAAANHAFLGQLAGLCAALVQLADDLRQPGARGPRLATEERVRTALERLLIGLVPHAAGGLLPWAARLNAQLAAARAVIEHPELGTLLGVTGAAAVLRALTDGAAVELGVAIRRGQAGHRLLAACARLAERLRGPGRVVEPTDAIVRDAAEWLAGYGLLAGSRS
ncbi:MAG: hypothetical protein QM767_29260 [Anaeromyxobacter sp.]